MQLLLLLLLVLLLLLQLLLLQLLPPLEVCKPLSRARCLLCRSPALPTLLFLELTSLDVAVLLLVGVSLSLV